MGAISVCLSPHVSPGGLLCEAERSIATHTHRRARHIAQVDNNRCLQKGSTLKHVGNVSQDGQMCPGGEWWGFHCLTLSMSGIGAVELGMVTDQEGNGNV